jgi:protein Tex
VEPRHVGVGLYQHDVKAGVLGTELDHAVLSCVNKVGVDLNTASPALLARVAGLSATIAQRIVR